MANNFRLLTCLTKTYTRYNGFQHLRCFARYNKDLTKQIAATVIPNQTTNPDYLLQNLKNATNPQNVLELVGTHHKIMNSKQLIQALRSLFTLQKYGNSSVSMQQIINHPDFEKLCWCLKTHAGVIELNETIEALKIISYMGVSSNSTIVQVLLQLLRHNINDFTLYQIMFLDFLLKQFKSSPLVDGLLIALPIVFEVNLPLKMDRDNVAHLVEFLKYASKKPVTDACIELIVNSLTKCIDTHGLDAKTANSILWSICDMDADEFFEPLFKKAMTAVLIDFDHLNFREAQTTLTKLIYKYSPKYSFYYNDTFLDACANYIVDNDMGFEEAAYTLKKFIRVGHSHDNLLNYVLKMCHKNSDLSSQIPALHLYHIIMAVALTEFRPTHWDTFKECVMKTTRFKNHSKRDILWIKFAASLCALDIYKFDVLEKALNHKHIEISFKNNFVTDCENLVLLNQAIRTFQPDFKHLLPSKSVLEQAISKLKPVLEYSLEAPLQKALGGESYVRTCVKSELGHHIDHLIVMRKGGYPVPLSKTVHNLESLEVPSDGFVVLILALGPQHYTINNKRLKATSSLMIRTLEAKGHIVVPICMEIWECIADFEKIPYLMQAIRLKTENRLELSDAIC